MKRICLFLTQMLIVLSLLFVTSCDKEDDINQPPVCSIVNPPNNTQFGVDENILVTAVAEDSDGAIIEVKLYVNNVGHSLKTTFPYNFTINAGELTPGTHTLKAVAKDNQGTNGEATVSIIINQLSTESSNFVSFADGKIPNTWQTTTWTIDNTIGYDDLYSLKAIKSDVAVVTTKTFEVFSYIEFFTTGNNFNFYIDGIRSNSINSSNTGNWQQWIYALSPGTHTLKWETTSSSKLNIDAIKFAPSGLPEVHTIDITQRAGNFATVNCTLSSNGNNVITALGICWSTTPHPTINDSKTTNTEGLTGNYTNSIKNLIHNTTYYVRAYASNGAGTVYGEELSFSPKILIGDHYQGGIVAYIDATGKHGLIAAPEDQSSASLWNNGSSIVFTGAIGTAIGTGKSNTKAIVKAQGEGIYAAKLCDDLVLNGYDDWYLPSKDELNILYQNKDLIGGFDSSYYWSSSELYGDYNYAWYQEFYAGRQDYYYKNYYMWRVRAVRDF